MSIDYRRDKSCNNHTMKYHTAVKKVNYSYATIQMKPIDIIVKKLNRKQEIQYKSIYIKCKSKQKDGNKSQKSGYQWHEVYILREFKKVF